MSFNTLTPVNCGVLHPNQGELVLGGADGKLRIWDLAADKCCAELVRAGARCCLRVAFARSPPHTRPGAAHPERAAAGRAVHLCRPRRPGYCGCDPERARVSVEPAALVRTRRRPQTTL